MRRTVRLGAYDLLEVLGRGATGQVWKATYGESIVAVKLLDKGISPEMNQVLTREVHALASLTHPHIVTVVDFGHISEAEATQELSAGQPYVVFEYASRGALDEYLAKNPTLSWPWVRRLLFAILDGLAHAHARNVIHRDLKPANIIGFENPKAWKITDFGLAFLGGETAKEHRIYGTPQYMAPEQFQGDGYLYAPHTDLYALGVLAYQLVCGRLPFNHKTVLGLAQLHLTQPVPQLTPLFPTPPGLEAWIGALLAKDVSRRFELAADAAAALRGLSDASGAARRSDSFLPGSPSTMAATMLSTPTEISLDVMPFGDTEVLRSTEAGVRPPVAPQPPTWRRARVEFRNPLTGSSARLFALRARELVGRDQELEELWATLVQVRSTSRVRCTMITGDDGVGKTALAKWFAERAAETGAATVVELREDAWETMYSHARAGSTPEIQRAVFSRIAHELDAGDVLPLWLGAGEDGETALVSYMRAHGLRRPVILVVDGLGADLLGLRIIDRLQRADKLIPHAVHVVATSGRVTDGVDRNEVQTVMRGADIIELRNLSRLESSELLSQVLKFDLTTADRLFAMSNGNPRILFDVIEDWVDRDLLFETLEGFAVVGDATSNLGEAWRERLEDVLATPGHKAALVRAAILGVHVSWGEWTHLCRSAGVPIAEDLVSIMVRRSLAAWTEQGFSFSHGLIREVILAQCDIVQLSLEAVQGLEGLQAQRPTAERWGRIGALYLAAKHFAEAIEPLKLGAEAANRRAHFFECRRLSRLRLEAAKAQGDAHGVAMAKVAYGEARRGTHEQDEPWYWDEIEMARSKGWDDVLAAAFIATSDAARLEQRYNEGAEWATQAMQAFERISDATNYAKAVRMRADVLAYADRFDEAHRDYVQAQALYRKQGHAEGVAWCDYGLGYVAQQWGDQALALEHLKRAADWYRANGHVGESAAIENSIGDTMYRLGRFEEALDFATSSVRQFTREGRSVPEAHASIALCYLALGDVERFKSAAALVARNAIRHPHFLTLYASMAALERDWDKWDEFIAEIDLNEDHRGVDLAIGYDAMVTCANLAGAPDRVEQAQALAAAQWARVGRSRVIDSSPR